MSQLRVFFFFVSFFYFLRNKRNGIKLFLLVSWFPIHASVSSHRLFSSTLAHDMPFLTRSCPLQDFLGQTFCTLGEIVGSPASRLEKPLGWVKMLDSPAPTYLCKGKSRKRDSCHIFCGLLCLVSLVLCVCTYIYISPGMKDGGKRVETEAD